MPSSHEHDAALSQDTQPPPGDSDSLDARIDAEIADHLAMASHELVRRGEKPESAVQLAMSRFGDIGSIKRRCRWIQQGDEIMFRTVGIALMACLVLAMGALAWSSWSKTEQLTTQLASLTKTQEEILNRQLPVEFSGRVYLGDPSVPAKGVTLTIYKFTEKANSEDRSGFAAGKFRTVQSDDQGRFQSGPLASGAYYSIVAPVQLPHGVSDAVFIQEIQSQPIFLANGVKSPAVTLNVLADAKVLLKAGKSIPDSIAVGNLLPKQQERSGDLSADAPQSGFGQLENLYFEAALATLPLNGQLTAPTEFPQGLSFIPLFGWSLNAGPTAADRILWLPSGDYKFDLHVRVGTNIPSTLGMGGMGGQMMGGQIREANGQHFLLADDSFFGSYGRHKTIEHTLVGGKLTTITINIAGEPIESRMKQLAEEAAKPPASSGSMSSLPLDNRFVHTVQNALQPEVEFSTLPLGK
ncbi:MAG: permease prefix domain 1-containing protein [Planctomycetota bacterium]|nr:permease prefix domain 1-containing protein [Planctomycetota bacterium]